MAYRLPTLPDDKINFYREKLFREVSNLFIWKNVPNEIPTDYLERTLIRHGRVMFFYDDEAYGYMALRAGIRGFNIYEQPTHAFAVAPNDQSLPSNYERTIVHKYNEEIGKEKSCVLINNMYGGESLWKIVDHYAFRLALIQQAFDTNALWQNIPVLISVSDDNVRLSLEKMFSDIFTGKPWIVIDKVLTLKEAMQAEPITVDFILDKLYDVKNEVYNEFKQTIGIDASAVEKRERVLVDEVTSNEQITETCLEIMLKQRKIACEEIKKVFGLNIAVDYIGSRKKEEQARGEEALEGGVDNGSSDD